MEEIIISVESGTGKKWRVRREGDKFIAEYLNSTNDWRKSHMMPRRVELVLKANQAGLDRKAQEEG